jgi:protein-disulfide isomerase
MRQSNAFIAAVILIALPIMFVFGFAVLSPVNPPTVNANTDTAEMTPLDQPTLTFGNPTLGPKDAPVTIFSFGDYQCPPCATMDATLAQIWQDYQTKVRVVWKDMPDEAAHSEALNAAVAARCADEQGAFWPYHSLLMKSQDSLSSANYPIFASELGLDATAFQNCLDNQTTKPLVDRDLTEGIRLNITATPYLFINGRRVSGAIDPDQLRQFIDSAIAGATTPTTTTTNTPPPSTPSAP